MTMMMMVMMVKAMMKMVKMMALQKMMMVCLSFERDKYASKILYWKTIYDILEV